MVGGGRLIPDSLAEDTDRASEMFEAIRKTLWKADLNLPFGMMLTDPAHPKCRGMGTGTPYVWCFACDAVHSSLPFRHWVADT